MVNSIRENKEKTLKVFCSWLHLQDIFIVHDGTLGWSSVSIHIPAEQINIMFEKEKTNTASAFE